MGQVQDAGQEDHIQALLEKQKKTILVIVNKLDITIELAYDQIVKEFANIWKATRKAVLEAFLEREAVSAALVIFSNHTILAFDDELETINNKIAQYRQRLAEETEKHLAKVVEFKTIDLLLLNAKMHKEFVQEAIRQYQLDRERHPCAPGSAMRDSLERSFMRELGKVLTSI